MFVESKKFRECWIIGYIVIYWENKIKYLDPSNIASWVFQTVLKTLLRRVCSLNFFGFDLPNPLRWKIFVENFYRGHSVTKSQWMIDWLSDKLWSLRELLFTAKYFAHPLLLRDKIESQSNMIGGGCFVNDTIRYELIIILNEFKLKFVQIFISGSLSAKPIIKF